MGSRGDFGKLVALIRAHHGVISFRDLTTHGIGRSTISRACAFGIIERVDHGVYATLLGETESSKPAALVAASGPNCFVWRRSTLVLVGLLPPSEAVDCAVNGTHRRRRDTAQVAIAPVDLTVLKGLPSTTVARALVDFAAIAHPARARHVFDRAARATLATAETVSVAAARRISRRGRVKIREFLDGLSTPGLTRSLLEAEAARLLRGKVGFEINKLLHLGDSSEETVEVDIWVRDARLAIELDSNFAHSIRTDRRRDDFKSRLLLRHGIACIRFDADDIFRAPDRFVRETLEHVHLRLRDSTSSFHIATE